MSDRKIPPYLVKCYGTDCEHEAIYKIASRWSDGLTSELKTYFLACDDCVSNLFQSARVKKAACRLIPEESLGEPQVFEMTRGMRDRELVRREELEV